MRSDIITLHRAVAKTFIFVTHDQVEAMTMATTIIVMNEGVIQQVGTPDEVYDRPQNTFVATFVGSPPMNLIGGDLLTDHPTAFLGGEPTSQQLAQTTVGIRPEHLEVLEPDTGGLPADIEVIERVGAETIIGCRLTGATELGLDMPLIFARVQSAGRRTIGEPCALKFDVGSVSWFDRETGRRIDELDTPARAMEASTAATEARATSVD
jgi:multiple sugar transport system ATP-binding protein